MKRYIVLNDTYTIEEHEGERPINFVFSYPRSNEMQDYILPKHNIKVIWNGGASSYNKPDAFKIIYKNVTLVHLDFIRIVNALDYLNRFNSMSSEELEELYQKALAIEKTKLEIEVDELKETIEDLHKKAKIYLEIQEKRDELKKLVKKLDSF